MAAVRVKEAVVLLLLLTVAALLLLISSCAAATITAAAATTITNSTTTSPTYPDFQELNVKETIMAFQINSRAPRAAYNFTRSTTTGSKLNDDDDKDELDHEEEEDERSTNGGSGGGKWKVKVVHRDKMSSQYSNRNGNGGSHTSHRHLFRARMKRDAKRVASLTRHLLNYSNSELESLDFGSGVVSGMEQGSGEYFVRIGVGSPPRNQYMVIDSGSDIVWVQCQPCTECYHQSDPIFDPARSASYSGVSCASSLCGRLQNPGCHSGRCRYEASYGDGSYTQGTLALETLTLGRALIRNVAIGCGHMNRGMFVGAAGLLGLGGGPMSFVGQLAGLTGGAFTYCLVSRGGRSSATSTNVAGGGGGGSLEFGRGAMPVGASWVPLIRNPQAPSFYFVGLAGLGVGGMRVPISGDVFGQTELGYGGVVMDTGTAVTRFPTLAYEAFRDTFLQQTASLPRLSTGVSIFDTCYDLNGFVSVRVPTVSFYFSGGPILTLPASNFLIPVDDKGTFCFAFAPSPSGLSIIGNIQQEGIQISFDGANGFVGFGPNVC
ncbi:protein ASPARTIC PROTEASE IN GUARD CELL 2-like [Malus sylvestris]|uniref:protein ASPARTIC PROTEASE IN GUARD CELL 2-like n=1 Tax=Malus sylvestris TaxID=3752 RepID=UPI0021ABF4B0|nr:protein ASPARTIC PROTEASE IN GUARD CELL 2-like [Malus sylvestris]